MGVQTAFVDQSKGPVILRGDINLQRQVHLVEQAALGVEEKQIRIGRFAIGFRVVWLRNQGQENGSALLITQIVHISSAR
jgi:hypothetical protein